MSVIGAHSVQAAPLASTAIPLDGSTLTLGTSVSGQVARVTLDGTVTFGITGQLVDGRYADQLDPGLGVDFLRIEPGDWKLIEADQNIHHYVFESTIPLSSSPSLRINVDGLVDKFVESPLVIRSSLEGQLLVSVAVPPATPIPFWQRIPASTLAGTALAILLVGSAIHQTLRLRLQLDSDLKRELKRVKTLARKLRELETVPAEVVAELRQKVGALEEAAARLCSAAISTRKRLRRAGWNSLQREISDLEATKNAEYEGLLGEKRKLLTMLHPMDEEQRVMGERLKSIGTALETLRIGWISATPGDHREARQRAEALVQDIERDVKAVVEAHREMDRLG